MQDFDLLLDDLLPEDFRQQVRYDISAVRYEADANPTLAEDAVVFERMLEAEEQQRETRPQLGMPTGLKTLDDCTGGLGGLVFVGGASWTGKTTLALVAGKSAIRADDKVGVLLYSLDPGMSKDRIMKRMLSHESGVDFNLLTSPTKTKEQRKAVAQALARLKRDIYPRMKILTRKSIRPGDPLTADAIREACDQLRKDAGVEGVLVIIDYLGLMPVPADLHSDLDRDHYRLEQLQAARLASQTVNRPEGDTFLVLLELRKEWSDPDDPVLQDVMGSARLGYSADLVLLMRQVDPWPDDTRVTRLKLKIAKCRDGMECAQINLLFHHTVSQFEEAKATPKKPANPIPGPSAAKGRKPDPLAGS